ncbi:MAG: DUF512 domain-containing protein [Saccharofermentanales bacterium]
MIAKKHRIASVEENSIAHEAGIAAGDLLVSINGEPVVDVFDYRTRIAETDLTLMIEKKDGSATEIAIEKDEYEDLGLEFENVLMDREKSCRNKCVFCFIDQLPPNLRQTLYFKDDDLRLSFLTGNYVTLTNIDDAELDRLIAYRLSPMNISVHTTNPALRVRMLGNKHAGRIMDQLRRIAASGILLNTQIVLCPGLNDGSELERTLDDLEALAESIQSIALVPVGLTGHRGDKALEFIKPFGRSAASNVLETVMNRQQKYLQTAGRRIVFGADELYLKAGIPLPPVSEYEDFFQLENGVGTVALFLDEMQSGIAKRRKKQKRKSGARIDPMPAGDSPDNGAGTTDAPRVLMITGNDAYPYIAGFADELSALYGATFEARAVSNTFFGETVTVAGLVTGGDIVRELAPDGPLKGIASVMIPDLMLRHSKDKFLDDMTIEELGTKLGTSVYYVPPDGTGFLNALDGIYMN